MEELGKSRIARDVEGHSNRSIWKDVPDEDWNDWRWQQQNRVRRLEQLEEIIELSESERRAIKESADDFRMAITPYYASLMDPKNPLCPIRLQAVPQMEEMETHKDDLDDPLGEEHFMPVPGITHRYPDRVLFYVTHNCPMYCRHCTRKRKVSDPHSAASHKQLDIGLDYIRRHPEVRDVLVSGGDPMTLSDDRLVALLQLLRDIPHVEIIRLCTRNPVTLPQRFTEELVERLKPLAPIFLHTHFNTPKECSPEAARCLRLLANGGINLGNQMVLLKGINDDAEIIKEVNLWLLRQRCRPYYLFQADLAKGISHFRVPIKKALQILKELRGPNSGMAIPHYVLDAPGGGGKVPLLPNYVESFDDDYIVFRNWKGDLYRYPSS